MRALKELFVVGLALFGTVTASLSPEGVKCGEKRCSTIEYCSSYDKHCKPCSAICDAGARNYQPLECVSDCQEYLHDKRYVLLKQYEDLRGEIGRLWILVAISIAVAFSSMLSMVYLFARKYARWDKMRATIGRAFIGNRMKRTSNGNGGSSNTNNNNHRKSQQDAELGTSKQNGLKLTMPTISASVAPSRHSENGSSNHGCGNGCASGSGSGSGSGIGNATPNTTSTSLSRRHPSEDTTLDYAYDNPAMTPSPETVQLRTKRESSF